MRPRTGLFAAFPVAVAIAAFACGGDDSSSNGDTSIHDDAASTPDTSTPAQDSGGGVDSGTPNSGKDGSAPADGGLPVIVSTVKAAVTVDYTGQEFGAPEPDGAQDATATAVINGAFDALVWVSVDADGGGSAASNEWDTVVNAEALPDLDTPFTTGGQTWTTAVANGATVLNDATGHVSVGPGLRTLTVSCAQTPIMMTGQNFRLYVRQGTTWIPGPLFAW